MKTNHRYQFRFLMSLIAIAWIAPFIATAAENWPAGPPIADPGDLDQAPSRMMAVPNQATSPSDRAEVLMESEIGDLSGSIGLEEVLESPLLEDGYLLQDYDNVAPVQSTGTWLQRGYWFAQEEAVVFVRNWRKHNPVLAREQTQQTVINYSTVAVDGRSLQLRSNHPAFASARMTLGRFMFRDHENRDHFTEVTFLGAGQEQQRGVVHSLFGDNLVNPVLLGAGNEDFSGSDTQWFVYTHNMNSLEFNYRIKGRMDRDQMILLPDGTWVRRAKETLTHEFLAGMRWMSLNEWLVWEAEGERSGDMRITTHNNLLGFQMGYRGNQDFARFSIGLNGKAGVYVNFTDMARDLRLFDDGVAVQPADSVRVEEETLAFIGETSVVGRYHIHQNFSLRVSGELLYVDSLAIAPFQTTFATDYRVTGLSGHSLYLGVAFGIEGYW